MDVQVPNGVVDVAVPDEAAAVDVARRYLSLLRRAGRPSGRRPTPRLARRVIPENRLTVYDVRAAVDAIADVGSVLELRAAFGLGMVTALVRVEGRPMGVVANNPMHLAGAIDADGADKAARFLQLCDAFDLPVRVPLRHAGDHGGPRGRADGAGAPREPAVRHRRQRHRAHRHDHPAEGLRPRRPGDGGRQLQGAAVLRGLAHGRARRDGARGRGAPRLPQGARGHRRSRPSASGRSRRWSTACTSTARRSTPPATSRSTT